MLLIRQLLYKEKKLDDFDIDSEGSIFKIFFNLLLTMDGTRVTDMNVESNITSMFNDACYICTVSLLIKRPALQLGYFRELCNQNTFKGTYYSTNDARADVVLCMVYFLLKFCGEGNENTRQLMAVIDTNLRERTPNSNDRYERFFDACHSFQGMLCIFWVRLLPSAACDNAGNCTLQTSLCTVPARTAFRSHTGRCRPPV